MNWRALASQAGARSFFEEDPIASWGKAERGTGRLLQPLDINGLHDQLDTIRSHLKELSHAFSRATHNQLGRARAFASEAAHDAEETMHDHLAASMLVTLGLWRARGLLDQARDRVTPRSRCK
jgi:hypothetical protein